MKNPRHFTIPFLVFLALLTAIMYLTRNLTRQETSTAE